MTNKVLWIMVISVSALAFQQITAYINVIPTHSDTTCQNALRPRTPLRNRGRPQPQICYSKFGVTLYSTTEDSSNGSGAGAGGLVRQTDNIMKKQLLNAFTNLGTADQYDAVLTGLCAKILDDTTSNTTPDKTIVAIQDCTDLLDEMNASKITASSRSLMALIDVSLAFFLWKRRTKSKPNTNSKAFTSFYYDYRPQQKHKVLLVWHV
jgi:hypothetical protein